MGSSFPFPVYYMCKGTVRSTSRQGKKRSITGVKVANGAPRVPHLLLQMIVIFSSKQWLVRLKRFRMSCQLRKRLLVRLSISINRLSDLLETWLQLVEEVFVIS